MLKLTIAIVMVGLLVTPGLTQSSTPAKDIAVLDPLSIAPGLQSGNLRRVSLGTSGADIEADEAGRLHFRTVKALNEYFDHWLSQDRAALSAPQLMESTLRLTYGTHWNAIMDRAMNVNDYRRQVNKRSFWLLIPKVSFGNTNAFGSSLQVTTSTPALPTLTTSLQNAYSLGWDVGGALFARGLSEDAAESHLATVAKMRKEAVSELTTVLAARRAAQLTMRACLIDSLESGISDERTKELRKCVDTARSDLVKANMQIDLMTDGFATRVVDSYPRYGSAVAELR